MICQYCGRKAKKRDSSCIYGKGYGDIYICFDCDAYVGVHKTTGKPLGTLANKELRKIRMATHRAFDPIWKRGSMKRRAAYIWLAEKLGIRLSICHIGLFDQALCKKVLEVCLVAES